MPSVSASCGAVTLTSRRSGSTWSQASYNATLTFDTAVPTNCTVSSAVLTATISADPMSGSTVYLNGVGINSGKGSKSINVSVSPGASTYSVAMTFKGSGTSNTVSTVVFSGLSLTVTYTLNQVKSTFTLSTTSVEAGGSVKVTISPYLTTYTHTVTLAFGNKSSSTSLAAGTTTTTLAVPIAWLDQIPSASSGLGSVTVATLENGTAFGSNSTSLTVKAPSSAAPDIGTCAVAPLLTVGGVTYPSVVSGGYVQNKSGYKATITGAGGKYGASIQSYNISGAGYSGTTATLSSGLLTSAGSQTITFKVTDTRGMTASKTMSISVTGYSAPSIVSMKAYRVDDTGAASLQGGYGKWGRAVTYTTLGGANALTVKGYLRSADGTEQLMAYEDTGDGTSWVQDSSKEKIALPLVNVYVVRVEATDKYGSVSQTIDLPSANFAMHFNAAGNGVCFGGASTRENAVEIVKDRGLYLGDYRVGAAAQNLLDNSDFAHAVNQRGATGKTIPTGNYTYTIDRWKVATTGSSSDTYVNVATGYYVSIAPPSASTTTEKYTELVQNLENYSRMKGKNYTLLVKFRYLGKYYEVAKTFVMGDAASPVYLIPGKTAVRLNSVDGANIILRVCADDGGGADYEVAFYYAALYEGAYTEKNVPPYVPKGYAAELAECQRYYYKQSEQIVVTPYYFSTTYRYYSISFPCQFRIAPSVYYNNSAGEYKADSGWEGTGSAHYVLNPAKTNFAVQCSGGSVTASTRPYLFVTYEASADL